MSAPGAGAITVTLGVEEGRVTTARLVSSRPAAIGAVLVGRRPAEALAILPRLFALCGEAHAAAARAALHRRRVTPAEQRRVLAEMLDSHGWNVLLAWPALLGEPPRREALLALRRAAAVLRGGDLPARRGALREAEALLAAEGLLVPPGIEAWAAATTAPAARLVRAVLDGGLAGFGATPPDLAEAGPALDAAGADALAAIVARHGHGLLARLARRLWALAALPRRLAAVLEAEDAAEPDVPDGDGEGSAETARGRLRHRLRIEGGTVRDWQVTAPTDLNFHPDGPALRGLLGAAAGPDLAARAAWHLAALDPCVPATVRVEAPAHA
ncbi:hypothetical protein [Paracraurococcus lichenis]|uniref:Hydrogenase expression/formation protein HupK n=1 Tax=Paracraurococcus lichenis TaxID=3064888 RepID=A0ABT9DZL3_9PROT|nr:hypothetical protein [Paracraurococcus sp. LOR1-02]MDO9709324.1 hypothetical protein [Paracraurococcus sp. LOR1-02]